MEPSPLSLDQYDFIGNVRVCHSSTGDFLKHHVLSPDGLYILVSSESNYMTSWKIPIDNYSSYFYHKSVHDSLAVIESVHSSPELTSAHSIGESIYDFDWYPQMSSAIPSTSCFIVSSRDHPIHMWDQLTGDIRCTYRAYNHLDEIEAANAVTFNPTGDRIYAGYNRMIRYFDSSQPGRNCVNQPTTKTKRDVSGQKGIISCFSFNTTLNGLYAAGSYDESIGLYSENTSTCNAELGGTQLGGVTCMRWSPCGNYLWAGGRRTSNVICWDVRYLRDEVGRVARDLKTNQRMSFSLDPWGSYICTGTQSGRLLTYDTSSFQLVGDVDTSPPHGQPTSCGPAQPAQRTSTNCVNSVSFHPYLSVVVAITGERHFDLPYTSNSTAADDDDDDDDEKELEVGGGAVLPLGVWSEIKVLGYGMRQSQRDVYAVDDVDIVESVNK